MQVCDPDRVVDEILTRVGKRLVVATNLGLGKPIQILNALYRRAKHDCSIKLSILTALSFCRPTVDNDLGKRLFGPYLERVYGDYEDLHYEIDRRAGVLPSNVRVIEFFFSAGSYLDNALAQRDFICSNYTHVIRDSLGYGINVVAMMMAKEAHEHGLLSMSCNADLMHDLLRRLKDVMVVGEINYNLPYMYGREVEINARRIDVLLENDESGKRLFSMPKVLVSDQEFMIGIYVSSLIVDDGCLQIGIGSLNDAIVYSLIMRHKKNRQYVDMLAELGISENESAIFEHGLCALTEMLTDGYLDLYRNGILKKRISDADGDFVAHVGFFIGSNHFYDQLKTMAPEERRLFNMRSISEINQLYGDEENRRRQRKNARYVNTCMKATLLGAVASDGLDNGKTVSGVGGQYNFVAMAHELEGARSIMMCRSTHGQGKKTESSIVFDYASVTIPRHLRDMVVTEYGIADLRGKTDGEVVKAMLNIADSRYQPTLLKKAKAALKIPKSYEIPEKYRHNLPSRVSTQLAHFKSQGLFKPLPFGSEFSEEEVKLLGLLGDVGALSLYQQVKTALLGITMAPELEEASLFKRMKLEKPTSVRERFYRWLLRGVMKNKKC